MGLLQLFAPEKKEALALLCFLPLQFYSTRPDICRLVHGTVEFFETLK